MEPNLGGATTPVDWPHDLLPPPFADAERPGLLDTYTSLLAEPDTGRELLVLLDGCGTELLAQHRALTPTLRALESESRAVRTVAPSTTATAMVSLHTGCAPAQHGVFGYRTFDPSTGDAVHQLSGDGALRGEDWMPRPGLAERSARRFIQIAPARHRRSLLSAMAYRGWELVPHAQHDRADVAVRALRRGGDSAVVHVHLDDVDHAGHVHGIDSDTWREALAAVDAELGVLLRRAPAGTRVRIIADHGMVDTDPENTVELDQHPRLREAVQAIAGEPRAVLLRAPGHDPVQVAADAQELLGERGHALTTDQAEAAGLWGEAGTALDERMRGRVGDVVILACGRWTVQCERLRPPKDSELIGVHGSLTSAESVVPLIQLTL